MRMPSFPSGFHLVAGRNGRRDTVGPVDPYGADELSRLVSRSVGDRMRVLGDDQAQACGSHDDPHERLTLRCQAA